MRMYYDGHFVTRSGSLSCLLPLDFTGCWSNIEPTDQSEIWRYIFTQDVFELEWMCRGGGLSCWFLDTRFTKVWPQSLCRNVY